MADDKSKTGGQDRQRINVNEDYELRDWAAKFGVTTGQLKQAVALVADSPRAAFCNSSDHFAEFPSYPRARSEPARLAGSKPYVAHRTWLEGRGWSWYSQTW